MNEPSACNTCAINTRKPGGIGFYIMFLALLSFLVFILVKGVALPKAVTIPIMCIGMIAFFWASFSKPQLSFLVLMAYAPFSREIVGQFGTQVVGLNLTNIMLIVILIGWAFHAGNNGHRFFEKASLNVLILAFCFWGFLSLLRAGLLYGQAYDMDSFFILFKRWVTPILLYFLGLSIVRDRETFKKTVFVIMLATFMIALMAIRDYMNAGTGSMDSSRIGGVFAQPNMLGGFFVYNMFFFLGFFLYYGRSLKYWLLLIPFLVCFRGIMVTFSRGAYLSFAFGASMLTFFRSKILFICVLLLLLALLANPQFLPEGIQYRLSQTFSGGKVLSANVADVADSSAGKRLLVWDGAVKMIMAEPLLGFGYATFPSVIGTYAPDVKGMDAHNTYLILAAEMGIPALLMFLLILIVVIKNSWWLLKHTEDRYFKSFALGVLGGVFGLILVNMFGSRMNSEEVSAYFWLLSGLVMRAVIMRKKGQII